MANKAAFFDRDGTLNVDKAYLYRIEEFEWTPDAVEAIRACNEQDFLVIVVTNQSGVARGYFTEEDVKKLHRWMNEELARQGAHIDAFYYCPHHPDAAVEAYRQDCSCRKPKAGMVEQACRDFLVEQGSSFLVGDADRDIECASRAGIRGVKYEGGSLLACVRPCLG